MSPDARNSTLYSSDRIVRRLPFTFCKTGLTVLWFLVCLDVVFVGCTIGGVCFEWYQTYESTQRAALIFGLATIPLLSLGTSCLDLHQRHKYRLRPKRIAITASVFIILFDIQLGSNGFYELWSELYFYETSIDLTRVIPLLASLGIILYVMYFALGLVALLWDCKTRSLDVESGTLFDFSQSHWIKHLESPTKPAPTQSYPLDQLQRKPIIVPASQDPPELQTAARHASSRPSSQDPVAQRGRSRDRENQSCESSLWDSSVAEISSHIASTIEPETNASTRASSSLVTPSFVRSSAEISTGSSVLPAYCESAPVVQGHQ